MTINKNFINAVKERLVDAIEVRITVLDRLYTARATNKGGDEGYCTKDEMLEGLDKNLGIFAFDYLEEHGFLDPKDIAIDGSERDAWSHAIKEHHFRINRKGIDYLEDLF